jgi:L-amino acid N-acyltransferase YncA
MNAVRSEDRRSHTAATEAMKIRDATNADLPAILEIYNQAVLTRVSTAQLKPVTIEERKNWIREHTPAHHPFWIAEIEGEVAGWLTVKAFIPRCAYEGTVELSVYVGEKYRRRGVARRLLEEAISRGSSLGISAVVGLIFGHNEASLKLFQQLGFERWGFLPRVAQLDGVERDLIILGRHVTRP